MTISVVIAFIFGVLLNAIITSIILHMRKDDGVFKIDYSNPEKDVYRVEFNSPLDTIHLNKKVTLRVEIEE